MSGSTQKVINLFLLIGLFYSFYFHLSPRQKIVYVNTGKLLLEYQGMKEAQAAFREKSALWQANADTLTAEFEKAVQKYESQKHSLTAKETQLTEALLRSKQEQLVQYREAIQQKAAEEDKKLQEQVLSRINAFIKDYGKKQAYSIIMGATTMGNIVYAEEIMDITDEVVKGLNSNYAN
jgi:outer membrane protein